MTQPRPCGGWQWADHRARALRAERIDLLRAQVDLALLNLDMRTRLLTAVRRTPAPTPAVEYRSATATVDRDQRLITIIAAPYEQEAVVLFRGQIWREVFERNAFRGIENHTGKVRVNRDHDRGRTIGKVVRFDPGDRRGLVAEIRIARTVLGDESLALASEDCLSASVGFAVPANGEQLDHRNRVRRINAAILDHIALVESPAYSDAVVLATA